jgi:metal-responsive CopG/Arc/MetJ family transcriptional regulator
MQSLNLQGTRNTAFADAVENKDQHKANLKQNSINNGYISAVYPKEKITQKPTPQPNLKNKYTSWTLGAQ